MRASTQRRTAPAQRRIAVRDQQVKPDAPDYEIVILKPIPTCLRPRGWKRMPDGQRAIVILGMGFERAFDYLSWDPDTCDAHRLAAQREVVGSMMRLVVTKYVEDRRDNRAETAALQKLAERLLNGGKTQDVVSKAEKNGNKTDAD